MRERRKVRPVRERPADGRALSVREWPALHSRCGSRRLGRACTLGAGVAGWVGHSRSVGEWRTRRTFTLGAGVASSALSVRESQTGSVVHCRCGSGGLVGRSLSVRGRRARRACALGAGLLGRGRLVGRFDALMALPYTSGFPWSWRAHFEEVCHGRKRSRDAPR